MAKSFELQNKIENLKAHYSVVKGNLDAITQAINDAIELKEGYLLEIENLEDELTTKQSNLLGLRREITTQTEKLEEVRNNITVENEIHDSRMDKYVDDIESLTTQADSLRIEIKKLEKKADELEDEIRNQYETYTAETEHFNKLIADLDEKLIAKNKEHDSAIEKIREAEDELADVRETIERENTTLNKRAELITKREEELEGIAEDYNRRHKELDDKEADMKVYARRLKKKYAEVYPGIELKI